MDAIIESPGGEKALVEKIIDRVFSAILSGAMPLGSRVREKTLAESLGVSRGPLREALRSLEGRGLIERFPNLGPRVISLEVADIYQIYVVREALEGMGCRLATELMTDEQLVGLQALVEKQAEAVGAGSRMRSWEVDLDFHRQIIRGAQNKRLEQIIQGELYDLLRIYRVRSGETPGRGSFSVQEHRDILSAMLERDPPLAESLMRRHIRNARNNLLEQGKCQQSA